MKQLAYDQRLEALIRMKS